MVRLPRPANQLRRRSEGPRPATTPTGPTDTSNVQTRASVSKALARRSESLSPDDSNHFLHRAIMGLSKRQSPPILTHLYTSRAGPPLPMKLSGLTSLHRRIEVVRSAVIPVSGFLQPTSAGTSLSPLLALQTHRALAACPCSAGRDTASTWLGDDRACYHHR